MMLSAGRSSLSLADFQNLVLNGPSRGSFINAIEALMMQEREQRFQHRSTTR
jgi:hypothetical protein